MLKTRLGLPHNTRQTSIGLLQSALADTLDLRLAVKQAHWTVRGPRFQQLHEFFDSLVAPLDAEIDTIAERIATLGGVPDGRAGAVAAQSRLEAYPGEISNGDAHLAALAQRFAALGDSVRKAVDEVDEAGDATTADTFTAASQFLDKSLWMLEAHLDGIPPGGTDQG